MPHLGPAELILILGIVIVLFGAGRISRLGGELGNGIRAFRAGLKGSEGETETKALKAEKQA